MKNKYFIMIVTTLGLFGFQKTQEFQIDQPKSNAEIIGTRWYSEGIHHLPGDSLFFFNENEVEYFMGELSWTFNSHYELENDTVIVQTVTAAFEVDDVTGLEPDLIQKFLISGDTMKLVYLANRRDGNLIEAGSSRYRMINDFVKIK